MLFRRFPFLLFLAFLVFPTICLALSETIVRASDHFRSNLSFAGEKVPLSRIEVYESLDQELLLLSEAKARVWLTLRRSPRYLPLVEGALAASSVPSDFRYLPLALANLDTRFRSGQRRGIWRLTEREAASMGLTVGKQLDERLDPGASSAAAAARLAGLKKSYGTWALALAAFLDEPALLAAMEESGGEKDLFLLYLPEDLSKAVSQVLAGKILYSSPQTYGYDLSRAWPTLAHRRVRAEAAASMAALAAEQGVDYKTFRDMNPHILGDQAPAGATLYLP
jgi:hypothetical protein